MPTLDELLAHQQNLQAMLRATQEEYFRRRKAETEALMAHFRAMREGDAKAEEANWHFAGARTWCAHGAMEQAQADVSANAVLIQAASNGIT